MNKISDGKFKISKFKIQKTVSLIQNWEIQNSKDGKFNSKLVNSKCEIGKFKRWLRPSTLSIIGAI